MAASQHSRPPNFLVNRGVPPPPVDALHVSSQVVLSIKAFAAYLTGKPGRLMMNGFSMSLQTTLSRKTPVATIANIHV